MISRIFPRNLREHRRQSSTSLKMISALRLIRAYLLLSFGVPQASTTLSGNHAGLNCVP